MVINGYYLGNALIMEIGKFAILWNCFENSYCNNRCNSDIIKRICHRIKIDNGSQKKFANVLNKRRRWFDQLVSEYVETGLYPGNARQNSEQDKQLMKQFLRQCDDNTCCGCLLIIYRIRNNLMHGLKRIDNLNNQLDLFESANEVLESIKYDDYGQE